MRRAGLDTGSGSLDVARAWLSPRGFVACLYNQRVHPRRRLASVLSLAGRVLLPESGRNLNA